jgi:hypothetical protein
MLALWHKLSRELYTNVFFIAIILSFNQSTTFQREDSVSVFRWNLLSWAKQVELVSVSGPAHMKTKTESSLPNVVL